jgi:hypothetical protein
MQMRPNSGKYARHQCKHLLSRWKKETPGNSEKTPNQQMQNTQYTVCKNSEYTVAKDAP